MGTGPYEPFDEEMLKPLVPHCKLVVSASAGYDDYDVAWMTKNNMSTLFKLCCSLSDAETCQSSTIAVRPLTSQQLI
jgi:phosphoglycerate dehydrogenase-like enzyme